MAFEIITRAAAKIGVKVAKHSPEILLGAGIISGVAATVVACKATLKADDILDAHKEQMEKINEAAELGDENYTEKDKKKDTALAYGKTFGEFVKLYAPAIGLGALAIGCVCASYGIMRKRNLALTAAYGELLRKYMNYRENVKSKYGEDVDREMVYANSETTVETDKDGNVSDISVGEPTGSPYARFFDASCPNWEKSPEYNLTFVTQVQEKFNNRLRSKGHVFLNEVYDALGFERTSAGAVVGWVWNGEGDNYIDFGIIDCTKEANRRFVNGLENVIYLDFNVDGVIYDKI